MAVRYPYAQSPSRLAEFIRRLPAIGKPAKFTQDNLKSLGYTSSNDRPFLSIIRFIGLVDSSGSPTVLWDEMRGNLGRALGKGLLSGYAPLFEQYPDAYRRDDESLRAFFNANTDVGAGAVSKIVSTFKSLASLSDFSEVVPSDAQQNTASPSSPTSGVPVGATTLPAAGIGMPVNINIELTVPSDPTGEVYEKFFKAMREHLIDSR